jgi:hypothetical protein
MTTYNFATYANSSTQADHGHINAQLGNEFTQRTNSHKYDASRDVVGVINSVKPEHYTTIYVTMNYKTSDEMSAGQWIIFGPVLSTQDWDGLPPKEFYGRDIAIGNDVPGRHMAWQQTTWTFKGFPTQAQFLQLHVVRRARTMGGDFGTVVPATQNLYVRSVVLSFGGYSQAGTTPIGGYGYGYGAKYGTEL